MPLAIQQSIISLGNMFLQRLVNSFGRISMAAFAAGIKVDNFCAGPVPRLPGGPILLHQPEHRRQRNRRVLRGLKSTIILSIITSLLISSTLFLFAGTDCRLFGLSYFPRMRRWSKFVFSRCFHHFCYVYNRFRFFFRGRRCACSPLFRAFR